MTDSDNSSNTVNITEEAEKTNSTTEIENKSNDYSPYWDTTGTEEYKMTDDTPSVHIWVSHQKMGTETSADPYDGQISGTKETTDSDNNTTDNTENNQNNTT